MDILAALETTPPANSGRRCVVGKWLDGIDDETPGKGDLVATLESTDPHGADYRTLDAAAALVSQLGLRTSIRSVGDHRRRSCVCYW